MKNGLLINRKNRNISVTPKTNSNKNYVTISVSEYWESDDPDFGEDEHNYAAFYLQPDDIDEIIKNLNKAKEFLLLTDHIKKLGD